MAAAAVIAVGAWVAGCDSSAPVESPTAVTSGSSAPVRYSGLAGTCPRFTGKTGKPFGAVGQGEPGGPSMPTAVPGVTVIDCQWRSPAARPSVSVSVSIYPNGFPPKSTGAGNAKHFFDGLRADADAAATDPVGHVKVVAEETTSGPAFVVAYPASDTVARSTLADNVVVTVIVRDQERFLDDLGAEAEQLLLRLALATKALTGEVVDDLR